ncbi:MAG: hypothetical protein GXO50_03410 [Chlorobi bacterium]|nr:hypothetical protein [Chlorobiota bacterium]
MPKIYTFIFFVVFCGFGRDVRPKPVVNSVSDKLYADNFDNVYSVCGASLIKYDSSGEQKAVFDSPYAEKITFIDTGDPLKIPVFYENINRIIFLDNKLTVCANNVNLSDLGIYGKALICRNETGGLWAVDVYESKLFKFDVEFNLLFEKTLFEISDNIVFVAANTRFLFLRTEKNDVFVFDNNGNFLFKTKQKISFDFQICDNLLSYFDVNENAFKEYDFTEDTFFITKFSDKIKFYDAVKSPGYLFLSDKKQIYSVSIKSMKE